MSSVRDKSDEEYSVIGDKGDLGFIDYDNCQSLCSYNPHEESSIFNISVPFPLLEGKPRSGIVGETTFDSITIKNTSTEPLDLWSVSIYDSKPENSFTISLMKPPSDTSDVDYIQEFMESFSLEDRVLGPDKSLTIWLSCKPKEIGLHTTAVHFSIGDETIERLVFVLAEDKISRALSSDKPFSRIRKKKHDNVNVLADKAFVVGRRPSKGSSGGYFYRLPDYPIPRSIREMVNNKQMPDVVYEGLTRTNYGSFFKSLIAIEEIKLEEDMREYDMACVTMKVQKNHFLTLQVPGLAERRPSLVSGDAIYVKLESEDAMKPYQGYIHRVEAEEIYLKFDQRFHFDHHASNLYNVQFAYNRTGMRKLYKAIEAAELLNQKLLFPPEPTNQGPIQPNPLKPISPNLNEEQKCAVEMILTSKGGSPYLIHGPPGTGKTLTLIEAILQIYTKSKNTRILVCAPSNYAADHILERLIGQKSVKIHQNEIFRLNAFSRPFEDVESHYLDFCHFEDSIFKCPSRHDLMQYRIIISTYTSASMLYAEGVKRGHFSYIFLDEAGQASEPEAMVPISLLYSDRTVVVLAGDPMQLGPVIFSKDAESYGLGTSYLERLFNCELYRSGDRNFMTKLVRNYRTHPAILHLPSQLFYEGELIPCKEENDAIFSNSWENIVPDKDFPLIFMGIQGCDEREGSNPSWFNRIEASKVVEIVRDLLEEKGLKEENIGVITPYRQQVAKIRGALEGFGWLNVKVGSVEQFQGQERLVIIISTVRSTIKHNEFDKIHYLGFLSNPRRFNVSLTRARALLIVIGNPHILCKDPHWNELLWYCVDNGSYKGCFLPKREESGEDGAGGPAQYFESDVAENNNFQSSEVPWDEKVDNWQTSEVPWGEEQKSLDKPCEGPWDEKVDNWQTSEVPWGEEQKSFDKPCEGAWGETDGNFPPPDDIPWE